MNELELSKLIQEIERTKVIYEEEKENEVEAAHKCNKARNDLENLQKQFDIAVKEF